MGFTAEKSVHIAPQAPTGTNGVSRFVADPRGPDTPPPTEFANRRLSASTSGSFLPACSCHR